MVSGPGATYRRAVRGLLLASSIVLASCGQETPSEPAAEAEAPLLKARHGGVLVPLEGVVGELVLHATGELHFHVRSEHDLADAGVTVTLEDEAGDAHAVALRWTDEVQGFVGEMESTPRAGEAQVLVVHEGHRRRASVEVAEILPRGAHEGSVVAVGDHVMEVTVEPDGHAHVYVLDAPDARLDIDLTLSFPGDDGHLHPLSLRWDPEAHHYVGHLEGLRPRPGALEIIAEEDGIERLGRGSLLEVGLRRPDGVREPESFELDMPELGAGQLPSVIAVE